MLFYCIWSYGASVRRWFFLSRALAIVQEWLWKIYLNQRVGKFEIIKPLEFNKEFIYWILRGVSEKIKNMWYWWAQPNISNKQIENLDFVFPSKEIQGKIVNFLNDIRDGSIKDTIYISKDVDEKILKIHYQSLNCFNINQLIKSNSKLINNFQSSILQDAIQWKLVPQDPSDEPASILIERIQTEKTKLIAGWKLKKQKPLALIKPEEIPYELPKGWEWVRLGEILKYIQRWPSAKYSEKSNIGIINQKCIQWRWLELDHIKYYSTELIEKLNEDRYLWEDDILLNSTWTGTIGRCILLDELPFKSYIADSHVTILRSSISQKYLLSFLSSKGIQDFFNNGWVFGTTNQIELSSSAIQNFIFPLPPIQEQVRIVSKIGELIESCELLDEQVKQSKEKSDKLMESVLQGVFNW
jgi:restriction endonuclease S subunit